MNHYLVVFSGKFRWRISPSYIFCSVAKSSQIFPKNSVFYSISSKYDKIFETIHLPKSPCFLCFIWGKYRIQNILNIRPLFGHFWENLAKILPQICTAPLDLCGRRIVQLGTPIFGKSSEETNSLNKGRKGNSFKVGSELCTVQLNEHVEGAFAFCKMCEFMSITKLRNVLL